MFNEPDKERFNKITDLTDEINKNDPVYYFKSNSTRRKFDEFSSGINLLKK